MNKSFHRHFVAALALLSLLVLAPRAGAVPAASSSRDVDSSAIVKALDQYHAALARGDTAAAIGLLSRDVLVLESGGLETREHYVEHHLSADMEFARAVPSKRTLIRLTRRGDVAWTISTSTRAGTFKGREIDNVDAELMVLNREKGKWKIRAIHWSSARKKR